MDVVTVDQLQPQALPLPQHLHQVRAPAPALALLELAVHASQVVAVRVVQISAQ